MSDSQKHSPAPPHVTTISGTRTPTEAAAGGEATQKEEKGVSEILKDQILLLGLLVFFIGIVSTEVYYSAFGLRYQFSSLPSFHLVYRGLSVLITEPYLLLPYLIATAWLSVDASATAARLRRFRVPISYGLIALLLAATYPLAKVAGTRQADRDMYAGTSTLPTVISVSGVDDFGLDPADQYRLLMMDGDFLVVFKPLSQSARATLPIIKRIAKGNVHVVETIR